MQDIRQRIYALLGTYRPFTESEIEEATLSLQRRLSASDVSFQGFLEAFNDPGNPISGLELTILKIRAEQARIDGDIDLTQSLNTALACCASTYNPPSPLPNGRVFIEKTGYIIYLEQTYSRYENIINHLGKNEYVLVLHEEASPLVPMLDEKEIPYIFLREAEDKGYIFKHLISDHMTAHAKTGRYIVERIAFLIHLAEMFNHYKNVINHLDRNEYILILYDDAKSLVPVLDEMEVPYIFFREVEERGYAFKYLVSNHVMARGKTGNWVIQEIGLKNIRFMYALGKSQWNFSEWNCVYDLILCFGPHQVKRLNFCKDTKKIQMGYPRYDGFFKENIDKSYWLRKLNCDPAKKTIVWLPTSGSLSSVKAFCSPIARLKGQYNIVVKPHPLSFTVDRQDIKLLEEQHFNIIIDELIDNSYLYYVADYIFSDYGGTSFGAIYTDRNLILLNVPDAENNNLTGIDSADIALRQHITNIHSEDGEELPAILSDPQIWEAQKQVRSQLRSMFFAPYYGNAADITADIFKNLDQILNYQENPAILPERDSPGPTLIVEVMKGEKMVHALTAEVEARDQTVHALTAEVEARDQTVQELKIYANQLEHALQEIQNSRAWRFAQYLRRLKSLVLPRR